MWDDYIPRASVTMPGGTVATHGQGGWTYTQPSTLGTSTSANPTNLPTTGTNQPAETQSPIDVPSAPSDQQVRSDIEASYNPIFAELDRRVGLLPEQEAALKNEVNSLATFQSQEAEGGKQTELQGLGESQTLEEQKSKRTLDEFSTDLADLLRKVGGIYGGSSGAEAVGAAIGKQGTRTRGQLLEARDNALRTIDLKMRDVESAFQSQSRKIDQWKASQLTNITQQIQDRLSEIEGQRASASSSKAQQLAELSQTMYFNAVNYMQNLDMMVKQYKTDMAQWREQRVANMEDFITQLKATGQYTGSTYTAPAPQKIASGVQPYTPPPAPTYGSLQGASSDEDLWKSIYQGSGQVGAA